MKIDNYQAWAKNLFSGACYAACISYLSGKDDAIDITRDILAGVEKGYIEDDGFVSAPHLFYNYCFGKKLAKDVVKKIAIKSLAELPEGEHIVEFKKTPESKESHFVIANKSRVLWDPSGNSITVQVGRPVSYRDFVN